MPRILDTGEIVADDDPRAQQLDSRSSARDAIRRRDAANSGRSAPAQAHTGGFQGPRGPHFGETSNVSPFQALNNRLLEAGCPRIPVTETIIIEPLAAVATLLAVIFFGLPGLLLVAFIYIVRELSSGEGPVHQTLSRWIAGGSTNNAPAQNNASSASQNQRSAPSQPAAPSSSSATKPSKTVFGGSGQKLGSK